MTDKSLLIAYLAAKFPSINEESIVDPEYRAVWIERARAWHKSETCAGFYHALKEFKDLQGHRHWSRETTLRHAHEALKRAGMA